MQVEYIMNFYLMTLFCGVLIYLLSLWVVV